MRPAGMTQPLMESVESYAAEWSRCTQDGRIDPDEMARLTRKLRPVIRHTSRVHENAQAAVRTLTGDGIYGDWHNRMVKAARAADLRLVVKNDDPEPDGPVTKKAA